MTNYILVTAAALLFSLQFFFNQRYQQTHGTGIEAALTFSVCSSFVIILVMLIISGFKVFFTPFSLGITFISSALGQVLLYYGFKVLKIANLSVYSVYNMLGGMLLPFTVGVIFYNEGLSVFKVLSCIFIVVSVILNAEFGKQDKKTVIYYMIVFFLNGMAGVLSKVHQSAEFQHTDSTGYMIMASIWNLIICIAILLIKYKKFPIVSGKGFLYASGAGIFNGVANLWLLISLINLPASVQYPIVTGGTMIFSTIISMFRKEKLTLMNYIATGISFVASVLVVL